MFDSSMYYISTYIRTTHRKRKHGEKRSYMKRIEIVFCNSRKAIVLDDVKEIYSLEGGVLKVKRVINGYDEICLYDHVGLYNEEV